MSLIFKQFRAKEWGFVLFGLVLVVTQVFLDLSIPDRMSEITRMVQTPGSTVSDIWVEGAAMLILALGSLLCSVAVGYCGAKLAAHFSRSTRLKLYDKVESFSMEEIGSFSIASLITRSTNDVTQVQMIVAFGLQILVRAPVMALWALAKILNRNWAWTLATGVAVAVLITIVTVLLIFAFPKFSVIQGQTDKLNAQTRENITGVRVVRAYNAERYQEAKFETANTEFTKTSTFVGRMMSLMQPGMMLIMNGLSLSIYWIGAYLINDADMMSRIDLFSDMVVFSSYAMQLVMSFMMLIMMSIMLPRAMAATKRIHEVLNTASKIKDGTSTELPEVKGEVRFENVSFRYPGAENYVLHGVSFTAKPGEVLAFIGSTGSGKSTVINLVPRFYDVTEGAVLLDGMDIRDYPLEKLRDVIGYVPQRAVLFTGSIAENIDYGSNGSGEATEEQIREAARIAQGADFIENLEEGYESEVSQGGTNFSGGQRQRLSIARAVCRNPRVFIFDDSFSALDYKTDRDLRRALREKTEDATVLLVAQRIGTIRDADRIIVLDEGRTVGVGTHEELIKSCSVYREIAESQLSKEELQ